MTAPKKALAPWELEPLAAPQGEPVGYFNEQGVFVKLPEKRSWLSVDKEYDRALHNAKKYYKRNLLYTSPQPEKYKALESALYRLQKRYSDLEARCTPRKPLTDEQIAEIAATPCAVAGSYTHTFARAIEAAHGIKGMHEKTQ